MLYYVNYGVSGCGDNYQIVDAENFDAANMWAYSMAVDDYHSYEGYHGVMSEADVAEELGLDLENENDLFTIEEAYCDLIENEIFYGVEEFDETNDMHTGALDEYGIFKI